MRTAEQVTRRDVVLAAFLSVLGLLWMVMNVRSSEIHANILAVPLFLAVTVPLLWRRAAPVAALAATLLALLAHAALFPDLVRCGVVLPTVFLLVFAAAAGLDLRMSLIALGVALATIVVASLTDVFLDASVFPPFGAIALVLWGIGRLVRSRARMVKTIEAQSSDLREAREERARLEVAADRARLSTELEALLQRRLAELARLAESGTPAGGAAAAVSALKDIEREGRRTLEDMRAIVGVLRDESPDAPLAPQPTLTHLEALLLAAKGADARLAVEGSPRVLPAGVELSAYRIVEHLLAALEDAPDVDVLVRFRDDTLELVVRGPAKRRPDAAIERARERVRLHHGTLATSLRDGRAEAVALLPMIAA